MFILSLEGMCLRERTQNIVMRCTATLEEKEVYIEAEVNSMQYKEQTIKVITLFVV
jgi:hypothetical protein